MKQNKQCYGIRRATDFFRIHELSEREGMDEIEFHLFIYY